MRTTALGLVITCASSSMASPFAGSMNNDPTGSGFVELWRQPATKSSNSSNGHLVFLGYPTGANHSEAHKFEQRSSSSCSANNQPKCSDDHTARNDICESLVTELNGDATVSIPQSPRQICYEGGSAESNEYCCVSWGSPVNPLTKGDLSGYATTLVSTCTSNGVSGKFDNVPVGSSQKCIEVCMSNRGTHC